MNIRKISITTASAFAILLGACAQTEQPLDIAYFQGLGGQKTDDYLKACVALKKPLLVKQDADSLDRFAKSVRAINCQTALRFAVDIESKNLAVRSRELDAAQDHRALKAVHEKIRHDFAEKWKDITSTFPEWKKDTAPLASAMYQVDIAYSHASSVLSSKAMLNYGR